MCTWNIAGRLQPGGFSSSDTTTANRLRLAQSLVGRDSFDRIGSHNLPLWHRRYTARTRPVRRIRYRGGRLAEGLLGACSGRGDQHTGRPSKEVYSAQRLREVEAAVLQVRVAAPRSAPFSDGRQPWGGRDFVPCGTSTYYDLGGGSRQEPFVLGMGRLFCSGVFHRWW